MQRKMQVASIARHSVAMFCAMVISGAAFGQAEPASTTGTLLQGGGSAACPPHLDAFGCCLYKSCSSPAGAGCVAFCALGKILTGGIGVFEPGAHTVTKFTSGNAVFHPEFEVDDAAVYFRFDDSGAAQEIVIRAGYYEIDGDKASFRRDGQDLGSAQFYLAKYNEMLSNADPAQWTRLGPGKFDESSGTWEIALDADVGSDGRDYVVRATLVDRLGHEDTAFAVVIGRR